MATARWAAVEHNQLELAAMVAEGLAEAWPVALPVGMVEAVLTGEPEDCHRGVSEGSRVMGATVGGELARGMRVVTRVVVVALAAVGSSQ